MLRAIFSLLLVLNLGFALWGWSRDRPLEVPPPPLPTAPEQIRLLSELARNAAPAAASGSEAPRDGGSTGLEGQAASAGSGEEGGSGSTQALPAAQGPGESANGPPTGAAPGEPRSDN